MNALLFSSPEPLESRIAPAGLVSVSFSQGLLTITGADNANHDVAVVKTGPDTFRVEGHGTDINHVGKISKTFHGDLTAVLIEGGTGDDTFALTKLHPLQSLTFHGNAGVDALTTTNLKTEFGGKVRIDLGSETGTVDFSGVRTTLHGPLALDLGGGGAVGFHSTATIVDGNVVLTGGVGSDSVLVNGESTLFKRKLTFSGNAGDDSFVANGTVLKVRGFVDIDGGADTDTLTFGADLNKFGSKLVPGLVDLNLGVGAGTVTFQGNSTRILGDLRIDLGTGGGKAMFNSATTTIRDHVDVTGGAGNDTLAFAGRSSIGKTLSFLGDTGDDSLTAAGGLFSVGRATTFNAGSGASVFTINVLSLAMGNLSVTGGTVNDTVSIRADGTIAGDVDLQLGLDGIGPSSVLLQSRAGAVDGLKMDGTLTINMTGSTVDTLTIANLQVANAVKVQTGENVSTVTISNLNAHGNVSLKTGDGADVVTIDNFKARDFLVDTESGADGLRIERNALLAGMSKVRGVATILSGIGADQIRIGNSGDPANLKVTFLGAMTLDAGDGANMRNDVLESNSFAEPPTITATGGTLTETAAA